MTKNNDKKLHDTLENLVAELGTQSDKRSHSVFVNSKSLSTPGRESELTAMYRTDWVSGKIVDIIPDDMTREWRTFTGKDSPEKIEVLKAEEDRLKVRKSFNLATKWARLYGTGFIVLNVDDGQEPDKPLDFNRIKPNGFKNMQALDRTRIVYNGFRPTINPFSKNYGMPEKYRLTETAIDIHHSRLIRFEGVELPYEEFRNNGYFSDSVLDRVYESVTNFNIASSASSSMIFEANSEIVSVKGLMGYLQTEQGQALIRKRFSLAKLLKSFNNMMLLDSDETYQKTNQTFAGLPDLIDRFAQALASASDIPATRLLGSSASGLNATGEGDLKNYYDKVRALQNTQFLEPLKYVDDIINASLGGGYDTAYEFNSLFQMSDSQRSDIELKNAQRDQIYLTNGILTESIIAKDLQQNATYTNISDDDIEALESFGRLSNEEE